MGFGLMVLSYAGSGKASGSEFTARYTPWPAPRRAVAPPSVVIIGGQSVKTTGKRGIRDFDGHKRVKGRKWHILVDTLGLLIASRVEPAGMSDLRARATLVACLSPLWPTIRTVIADAGHESRKLAAEIKRHEGWRLVIVKRSEPTFKVVGLNWIVERTFGRLGRHRRLSKDDELMVQTSETLVQSAAIRTILNRLAPA